MRKGIYEYYLHRRCFRCLDLTLEKLSKNNSDLAKQFFLRAIKARWGKDVAKAVNDALNQEPRIRKTGVFARIENTFYKKVDKKDRERISDLLKQNWARFSVNDFENIHLVLVLDKLVKVLQGPHYRNPVIEQFIFDVLASKKLDPLEMSRVSFVYSPEGKVQNISDPDMDDFAFFVLHQTPFNKLLSELIQEERERRINAIQAEAQFMLEYSQHAGKTASTTLLCREDKVNDPVQKRMISPPNGYKSCQVRFYNCRSVSDPLNGQDPVDFIAPILIREIFGK